MPKTVHEFKTLLYEEYLQEASFLYGQRLAFLHDPVMSWRTLAGVDQRFEAQISAIGLGGAPALAACAELTKEGDHGVLHATLRAYCRQNRKDLVFELLSNIDGEDDDVVCAVAQALRQELPTSWKDDLLRIFQGAQQHLNGVLAHVIGYRRFAAEALLTKKLASDPDNGLADIAWAMGRVGSSKSSAILRPLLNHEDDRVCEAAAIALLRLGDQSCSQSALQLVLTRPWAQRTLAIGGASHCVGVLLDILKGDSADKNVVLALGMLGDLQAVAPLVGALENDDLAESAAIALNVMTGAALYGYALVPEAVTIDELSDQERVQWEKERKLPVRSDGEPFGSYEYQLLCDPEKWRVWLGANKSHFSRERRWCMGQPHGPAALLACLRGPLSPYEVRAAAYEELVVRYGLTVPFEVDLPVHQQDRFLGAIDTWARTAARQQAVGGWYFAGQPQA